MLVESPYPPIDVPNVDIWSILFENQNRPYPDDKPIYIDANTSRTYTYAQVRSTAIDFGKGLRSAWEWRKGDVLALFTPNCIDTPAVTWGTHWAGGVVSPANPGYTTDELAFQLKDAGAKALITQKALLKVATEAAQRAGIPKDRIILIGDDRDASAEFKHFSSIRNVAGTSRYRRAKVDSQKDLAFLVYSSGTTGRPKGVMLTHENIVANILQLSVGEGANLSWKGGLEGQGDRILGFLPFFHIYGLNCLVHQCLYSGWTLVVMPKFEIEKFCYNIQHYKITYAYVVPPIVLLLGKHPVIDKYDLSSLRMMNSGAAPLTEDLVQAVYRRIKVPIKQGYGLSETSPTTHTQPWETWNTSIGSVGTMLPNQTAKFMSPEETEVPIGETGELWIRGPNIFIGYHNNAEATANALTPDKYFKTGDVGYLDKDGNFFITDRVKELIKYKGSQVAPAELEGILLGHPKITDAAVIGIEDKAQATELPRAYIVLKTDVEKRQGTADEIATWLQEKVANHKRLRGGIRFVNEVPKSASGKILRRLLKVKAAEEQKEVTPPKPKL
ncbi:uncharacterized protein KY384_008890 [Bacidia gigantensis]|uniref:uncharacterized protein n=1 Tax=Bacidia gigantensis TaxID=2732470 RepID=UPI001D055378|nr:uncharacterized protein KY384_008890 [Bacidia gigantensis]KAG8525246.1 hypothetical protein KY384_008890 [Bacidia gigantensis]